MTGEGIKGLRGIKNGGYLYGILNSNNQVVWVGKHDRPAEEIAKYMKDSRTHPQLTKFFTDYQEEHGGKPLALLTDIVIQSWINTVEGREPLDLEAEKRKYPDKTFVNYLIFSYIDDVTYKTPEENSNILTPTLKTPSERIKLIKELKEEGHPILNLLPGGKRKVKA